ncbi:hypothetical protein AVEN_239877-1 [Araneus ventricosus]|uniref:Uncharacterized protein n=1 Tax=Araneus ventricosus TaxID=182803 RepID=A0A4Y2L7X4_ARAVE|nr:hypothetical protein AVEN_239877-1 [Araneus ventricosus]
MKHLNRKEKRAWPAFKNVYMKFLGCKNGDDYVAHVEELLSVYKAMWCNMSLKVLYLHSHLEIMSSFGCTRGTVPSIHCSVREEIFREVECEHVGRILLAIEQCNFPFRDYCGSICHTHLVYVMGNSIRLDKNRDE